MNELRCPHTREAARMCSVLVNEVSKALTWADMNDAITAILRVRSQERDLVAEWEHLNHPNPTGGYGEGEE